jgi:hypothetical protein
MSYTTPEIIIKVNGIKPEHLRLEKEENPDTALTNLLNTWITQADAMIDTQHEHSQTQNRKLAVIENVALRLVSNMVGMVRAKQDTPLIKINDWTIQLTSSKIFTDDLKDDLKPFVVEHSSTNNPIEFSAITGDDPDIEED